MARKSILELIAQSDVDFPDNSTGAVTPGILRQFLKDFLNAIAPAFGLLQIPSGSSVQILGITPIKMLFTTAYDSDPTQITSAVPASTVTRSERGTSTINFTADFECQNGRFITFTLYKNGVALPWKVTGNGGGAGNPISVSLTSIDYADPAAQYEIRAAAEVDGTNVTLFNAALVVQIEPVRSYV